METLWPCVLFLKVQPSCDGKLLLFGYDAWWNLGYSTCKGRVFWNGLPEEQILACGLIPNPCFRILRKETGGSRTWEAILEAKYEHTSLLPVSPLPCPWLVKCHYSCPCLLGCQLLVLFIRSPFLTILDKSHTRLSSRLLRCCLCHIFDASAYLLGLKLIARLSQSVFPQNSLWMAYCFI